MEAGAARERPKPQPTCQRQSGHRGRDRKGSEREGWACGLSLLLLHLGLCGVHGTEEPLGPGEGTWVRLDRRSFWLMPSLPRVARVLYANSLTARLA